MKKHLIIAIVAAVAILSAVIAHQVLLAGKAQTTHKKEKISRPRKKTKAKKETNKDATPIEITHLDSDSCQYSETKNGVTIHAKVLTTPQECLDELGKKADRLVGKGRGKIFPIKMTIKNSTNREISLQDIGAKIASQKKVIDRIYGWKTKDITLFGLGAIGLSLVLSIPIAILSVPFILPIVGIGIAGAATPGAIAAGGILAAVASVYLTAGVVTCTGVATTSTIVFLYAKKRKKIRKKLENNSPKGLIIAPTETKSAIIFVRAKDYKSQFDITLGEGQNRDNPLNFGIKLPEIEIKAKKRRKKK